MIKAFVPGAGLGTRLRPLTSQLPKPLIPVHHRPLIEYAFEHLQDAGVTEFVVNTHHLPHRYPEAFPDGQWRGLPVHFRHEPVLLDTGGGLANVADRFQDAPFWVYNGDVLTDVPLQPAWERHQSEGNLVTLLLRSQAPVRNVTFDPGTGRVTDVRNALGSNPEQPWGFTGLYVVSPEFFRWLEPGKIESVVEGWLRCLRAGGRIGGIAVDDGQWFDLGDRQNYLGVHSTGIPAGFPHYRPWGPNETCAVHPDAQVHPEARIGAGCSVGPGAVVETGAVLERTIVWKQGRVAAGAQLTDCIVRSGCTAEGTLSGADV